MTVDTLFLYVIVKKLCYVAADYEAEKRKDTQASCEVDGEGWFTLSEERFKTAEILFQPQIGGVYVSYLSYFLLCDFIWFNYGCSLLTLQVCYGLA